MAIEKSGLLLAFYGDDFTGSTDALEGLALHGVPAALFLEPPTAGQVSSFRLKTTGQPLRACGVPGTARSMTPDQMDAALPPVFEALKNLNPPLIHYKTCSTFDSSPGVGNIGRAAEIGRKITGSSCIPLVIGMMGLGRYVIFGNLFARAGETVYRIDRHPTMSRHPVTPMDEADIRLHLAKQTDLPVASFDVTNLEAGDMETLYRNLAGKHSGFILFDTVTEDHLASAGNLIWDNRPDHPQFTVGSSGMEYALCACWQKSGLVSGKPEGLSAGPAEKSVVMSGSCAPPTAAQIQWSTNNGYTGIRLNGPALAADSSRVQEMKRAVQSALAALEKGNTPLLYTAVGPDDPAITETKNALGDAGSSPSVVLGEAQGIILKEILEKSGVRRCIVAGGDTAGHVTNQLGIYALEMLAPIAPGGPICLAHSENPAFDGLEIVLKGGQVGTPEFLEYCRQGRSPVYTP